MDASWEDLKRLDDSYGASFYLINLDRFERNYQRFLSAFRRHYKQTAIAYSYKTNYTPRLCREVDRWGGYAEVVSRMEYELARRIGIDPRRIIFNGPHKTGEDLEVALTGGSLVNVDSPYQVPLVGEVALRHPDRRLRVGVRVAINLPDERPTRFGFDADGDELAAVLERLRSFDVALEGLHCHVATRSRAVGVYEKTTERMLSLADRFFPDAPPAMLDLGGGFYSPMPPDLQRQFGAEIPSYDEYGEAIAARVAAHYGSDGPELILEPGVSITADIAEFVARVMDARTLGSRKLALVAGSIHTIKPTLNRFELPMRVVRQGEGAPATPGPLDVVGYTCMEHDVLQSSYPEAIATNDYVVFDNVGAYTLVLKPPFILEAPAVVAHSAEGGFEVLRRAETPDDVFATYLL